MHEVKKVLKKNGLSLVTHAVTQVKSIKLFMALKFWQHTKSYGKTCIATTFLYSFNNSNRVIDELTNTDSSRLKACNKQQLTMRNSS